MTSFCRRQRRDRIQKNAAGFTLIEIIIVVALIAFVYVVAAPNLTTRSSAEVYQSVAQLNASVRSAFDLCVLNSRPYRLVIRLATGEYWLEEGSRRDFQMQEDSKSGELSPEAALEEHKERFERYRENAGDAFRDPETDDEIPPSSPVLAAADNLKPPKWRMVDSLEWGKKQLIDELIIRSVFSEHMSQAVTIDEGGEEAQASIYFFPNGYVEKAIIKVFHRLGDLDIDEEKPPYVLATRPYRGEAEFVEANAEIDIKSKD